MKRRALLEFGAAILACPGVLRAQAARRFRVGMLWLAAEPFVKPYEEAFVAALRDLGYIGGSNLVVDIRYADGNNGRLPALADELIALKPDVLVGIEPSAVAMRSRTKTIPIVFPTSTDPVAAGLVQSLARPGTNVTGIATLGDQLIAKHIEILAEVVPKIARIGLLNDPLDPAASRFEQWARTATAAKGLALIVAHVRGAEGVREAFAHLEKEQPQGIVVVPTGRFNHLRQEIVAQCRRLRLPSISSLPAATWVEIGGLISYGWHGVDSFRYAARYVDRILKGAVPAEMPVEQLPRVEFIVNLKAAREIGVTIPHAVLLRADRIIE